jgi:hypothetical protein
MVHFQSKVMFQLSAGYIANNKFSKIVTLDSTDVFGIHYIIVFSDIRAVNMTVCWHQLLFQFSNFEFPNLAIYLDAAN